jgi:hypothetical protein
MPSPTRITFPPSGRPVGGLLNAARPIGGNWQRGVTFASAQCIAPQNIGPCPEGMVTKDVSFLSDPVEFQPFQVFQAVQCSRLGGSSVVDFADQSLDVTREFGVAAELLTGAATGNPSLGDAAVLTAAADPVAALGCLEQYAWTALSGRTVFIHVTAQIATALLAAAAIWAPQDGRVWQTAARNTVVISPGYDGREPGESAPTSGDPLFMYATGEVYAEVGERETLDSTDRTNNVETAIAEDTALVIFDPCFVAAIDTGLSACGGLS